MDLTQIAGLPPAAMAAMNGAGANPFMPTAVAPPPVAAPPVAAPPVAAAPGGDRWSNIMGYANNPAMLPQQWQNAPPQGLLGMLQRIQTMFPDRFAQLMASPLAGRWGITPDNLGTMQSRQDIRGPGGGFSGGGGQGFGPEPGRTMTPGGPIPLPTTAVAPVAPAGFAAPQPGNFGRPQDPNLRF